MVNWAAVQGAELPEKTHKYDNYKTKLCLDDKFKLVISDIWCSYMQIQQPRLLHFLYLWWVLQKGKQN